MEHTETLRQPGNVSYIHHLEFNERYADDKFIPRKSFLSFHLFSSGHVSMEPHTNSRTDSSHREKESRKKSEIYRHSSGAAAEEESRAASLKRGIYKLFINNSRASASQDGKKKKEPRRKEKRKIVKTALVEGDEGRKDGKIINEKCYLCENTPLVAFIPHSFLPETSPSSSQDMSERRRRRKGKTLEQIHADAITQSE